MYKMKCSKNMKQRLLQGGGAPLENAAPQTDQVGTGLGLIKPGEGGGNRETLQCDAAFSLAVTWRSV